MSSIIEGDNELTNEAVIIIAFWRDQCICLRPVKATQCVVVEIHREMYLKIRTTEHSTKNRTGLPHMSVLDQQMEVCRDIGAQ